MEALTSTRRGTIAELHVATAIMGASGGRISPFVPLCDDHGVDLVVLDKNSGATATIQIKSWTPPRTDTRKNAQFDVQRTTYKPAANGAVVCVLMDQETLAIRMSWLFPLETVPEVGSTRAEKFVLRPSLSTSSEDKYMPVRHLDNASLTEAVYGLLAK